MDDAKTINFARKQLEMLVGRTIEVVKFSWSTSIEFSGDDSMEFVIEQPYDLGPANRARIVAADVRGQPIHASEAVSLLGSPVTGTELRNDAGLHLETATGIHLAVNPSDSFEAWSLIGPGRARTVCMPGGELAVWT